MLFRSGGYSERLSMDMLANSGLRISCDRRSCTVSIILRDGFKLYKDAVREKVGFFEEGIIETSPVSSCPGGYMCIVKGKKSVKDYLCEEKKLEAEILQGLINSLIKLISVCKEKNVQLEDVVFDYRAVFLENNSYNMRFLYMPGASYFQKEESCFELIKVVFLHIYETMSEEEYREGESIIAYKEANIETLHVFLEKMNTWISSCLAKKANRRTRIVKQIKGWVNIFEKKPKNDTERENKKSFKNNKKIIEIFGEKKLEGVYYSKRCNGDKKDVIRIGRDKEWSDVTVNDMTASRRHAELVFNEEGNVTVRDMSRNGTQINGVLQKKNEKTYDIGNDIRILITESCGILVRYGNDEEKKLAPEDRYVVS